MNKLGIIAALAAEADCLYNKKLKALCPIEIQKDIFLCLSGIGYQSALTAAKKYLDLNINGLISWGVAGALSPSLDSGDLLLPASIVVMDKIYPTSVKWNKQIVNHFQNNKVNVSDKALASTKEICVSSDDKRSLLQKTGAIAVDMESAAIAEIAINNKLDFLVIRTIADKANVSIPAAVLKHTDNLGNPKILKFISSCLSKPTQIGEIMTLAKSYQSALRTLRKITPKLKSGNFFHV